MLEVIHTGLNIGSKTLLHDISFIIKPGEMVAICGPNGAGKSSLIRLLCGELKPSSGEVRWEGKSLAEWNLLQLARQRALMQQHAEVGFAYTALEIILLGRHPHHLGANRPQDYQIAMAAMQEVGAVHLAEQIYSTLSGGEQARVQMARVLAQIWESSQGARLLLLDEPTAALDPLQQHRMLTIARKWADKGDVAVVAIVHDLNLAAQYADRIALLRDGRLQAIDRVESIMTPAMVEACFDLPCVLLNHPDGGTPMIAARRHPSSSMIAT
ncbi:heme ABC transporter ATP-binding protein [Methylobacillus flagellatus]|uniref:Hemin import ATP-binding protein HmuV n=2 Tax=Methylobacillus TaxID=404 RepID=HMUV_METFK|nr:heme ABC transporter ATP-binding protein [Methylobacillus flagellatus]Q1H0W2.1 RecName: Full=Hemin import ATP-binding protein HmuV [Methylobacillus flagellatus KT]ABE49875.1 ABC transporter related protein [Methylobacillus flagellatus KT]